MTVGRPCARCTVAKRGHLTMSKTNQPDAVIVKCAHLNRMALMRHVHAINAWRWKYPHLMRADNQCAGLALQLLGGLMGVW
jgi:hypothetical protein